MEKTTLFDNSCMTARFASWHDAHTGWETDSKYKTEWRGHTQFFVNFYNDFKAVLLIRTCLQSVTDTGGQRESLLLNH